MNSYVLITPTRDEEDHIERTIQAVVAQTVRPMRWVIVSDGSVDRTEEIVELYTARYDFIQLVRRAADPKRNFGSKVRAFNLGHDQVRGLVFDFVGNLDADLSFEPTYYEGILGKFRDNERLGVAGGTRFDLRSGRFERMNTARTSVAGAFQLFRRQCFEEIGGYRPLPYGGIDAVAETMARMHGWQVESFPEFPVYHYRPTGTATSSMIKGNLRKGIQHYVIGYHPLFHLASCAFRMRNYPPVVGALSNLAGYTWAAVKRYEKAVPDDVVRYLRREQRGRLRSLLRSGRDPALRNDMGNQRQPAAVLDAGAADQPKG